MLNHNKSIYNKQIVLQGYTFINAKNQQYPQLKNYKEATTCLDEAIKIDPKDPKIYNQKGMSLFYQKQYESALECYDQAISIDSHNCDYYFNNKGCALKNLNIYQEAIECFDKALNLDQNNRDKILRWKGAFQVILDVTLKCLQNESQANKNHDEEIKKAQALNNLGSKIQHLQGVALFKLKKQNEALIYFNQAINIDPTNPIFYFNKGCNTLNCLKKYQEAIICYDQEIDMNPQNTSSYFVKGLQQIILGSALLNLKQYQESILCFDQAITLNANEYRAFNLKGWVLRIIVL